MTVSISKMSIDYYLASAVSQDSAVAGAQSGLTAYYTETETPAGIWFGTGLAGVGLAPGETVERDQAIRLYEDGADPVTGAPLGRRMQVPTKAPRAAKTPSGRLAMGNRAGVAGFDLTFSVPKSVSTLWALGDYGMQTRIESAHRQAMAETIDWIETNVAQTRAGHGGVAHVPIRGLIGTSFDHWESRDGDPQFHSHAVISNRVQRESDGAWVTLDSYTLHRHVVAISETYNSLLFDRLHDQVGVIPESRSAAADAAIQAALDDTVAEQSPELTKGRHRVELAGVPDALIEEFSTRSTAIEQRKDELIAQYRQTHGREPAQATIHQLRQQATLETRSAKITDGADQTLAQKKHAWRTRAIAAGSPPEAVVRDAVGHPSKTIRADMFDAAGLAALSSWALADASTQRTTFTRANVIASTERVLRLVRCEDVEQRRRIVDHVVTAALEDAVPLTPARSTTVSTDDPTVMHRGASAFDHRRHAGVWTTQETLDSEAYLLARTSDQRAAHLGHQQAAQQVDQVTTSGGHQLSQDQATATYGVLTSGRSLDAVIGPAGTGKTTTMSAITQLWKGHYGEASVVGLAPSAVAAGVLGDEIDVTAENTSKWLYENTEGAARRASRVARRSTELQTLEGDTSQSSSASQRQRMEQLRAQLASDYAEQARYTMRQDQLVIVDEASMVSNEQLHQLARQAEEAGAKVVLVGDPAQLGAVDAGGFLGHLDRTAEPHRLDMAWRFNHEWEREASLRLREGQTSVLEVYDTHNRLHTPQVDGSAVDDAYSRWKADRAAGKDSILIAADNASVAQLNAQARMDLVASGDVDDSEVVTLRNEVTAGRGDVLLARRNDRSLRDDSGAFLANGTRLTLSDINPDGSATARNQSTGADITLDAIYLENSTELGYATTAHRGQGVTTDTAHTVADGNLSRELFYVAMTRGREANHAYIDPANDPEAHSPDHWGLLRETPAGETAPELLAPVLARSSAERTAHETATAEAAYSNDLGRMLHEREYLSWAGRTVRTQEWVRQTYPADTAAQLEASTEWATLVDADPAQHYAAPPTQENIGPETVDAIRARCLPHDHHADPASAVPSQVLPGSGAQRDVLTRLDHDIVAERQSRLASLSEEQPRWYQDLVAGHDTQPARDQALEAALTWRALSDQNDAVSALGDAPTERDRLRPHYERAKALIQPRQPWSDQDTTQSRRFAATIAADSYSGPDPATGLRPVPSAAPEPSAAPQKDVDRSGPELS